MSKAVDEILNSIIEDFKAGRRGKEELEAKALFRLLNYCPPPANEECDAQEEKMDRRRG